MLKLKPSDQVTIVMYEGELCADLERFNAQGQIVYDKSYSIGINEDTADLDDIKQLLEILNENED